jgi:putative ABC transport system substrate-binding protein
MTTGARARRAGLLPAMVLLAVLAAGPPAAAQPPAGRVARIGYLHMQPIMPEPSPERRAFLDGLRALGYEVGRNAVIEYRSAVMRRELLPDLVEELVGAKVDIIVAVGSEAAAAARAGSHGIPIVIPAIGDPVGAGLVTSLARPGGNVTGLTFMSPDLAGKRLELLKQAFPKTVHVAVIWNPGNMGAASEWRAAQDAARTLGLTLQSLEVRTVQALPAALSALGRQRPHALYVVGDPTTSVVRHLIVEAAARQRLPAMYGWREFADAGGLMAYGADLAELFRRAAVYVDKIVKGARPSDLPVEQPTKFELVLNLKTARALGLTLPPAIVARADEIIR